MKFLCDVHISYQFSKFLVSKNYESQHVNFILNRWHTSDDEIRKYADQNDYILITKDSDFLGSFLILNSPKKLIKISLENIKQSDLIKIFLDNFDNIEKAFKLGSCCIEISRDSIRVIQK